ncbi:hypothetical protein [Neisseria arctica]|uniref:hypothetical protein n=1 Tax=Neisseria arctica TaxID=1470200 RepID=UPI000A94E320|nr:hypothetical protein [Neisseria arctica]UOO86508.1 hypothetical protein LVJ86_10020 [Neisseria arctica]
MSENKPIILFVNMARHFGGGEVQTERLICALSHFQPVFYGRKNSLLGKRLKQKNMGLY